MIEVKKKQLENQEAIEIEESVRELYTMETNKLRYIYKKAKFESK